MKVSLKYNDLEDYVYIFTSNPKYRDWYFKKDIKEN